jgi:hypothetical protein
MRILAQFRQRSLAGTQKPGVVGGGAHIGLRGPIRPQNNHFRGAGAKRIESKPWRAPL